MSVRKNQSREENEQLNSFKENLFGNLKDSLNINMDLDPCTVHARFTSPNGPYHGVRRSAT